MTAPFPSATVPENTRSTVLAPTVSSQGAPLWRSPKEGPLLPAEVATKTPFSTAAKVAMATGSSYSGTSSRPSDKEMTSTPSAIALSTPAMMSEAKAPRSHRTL
ncbi:unnamed protein product [Spirodela intermedia]|uniref:Uncharacterized protein n=1 Tax=Spirodela intermedia TaxID=51605 RepID=A0A7I8J377_SPIIN|nr:unnamed protein product [Spirodela intermedia]CAA6663800.1 unnamed protein product [Spirodela intermedia]